MDEMNEQLICLDKDYDKGIQSLAELVAHKKVVGVGESSHGTHEFFQLKADLACELIKNHGFTVFALEDNSTKCEIVNNFIQTGKGNVDEVLRKLYAVWYTEEMRELILRLRQLAASYDICFMGMDVDHTVLKEQPGRASFEERDSLMAVNILEAAAENKVFVWAHNSHVSRKHFRDTKNLGYNLAKSLTRGYAAIGQFFGQGSFSAKVIDLNQKPENIDYKVPLSPIEVPLPDGDFIETALSQAACDSYFIELSRKERIRLLDKGHKFRAFGAIAPMGQIDKESMNMQPYQNYDVLVYFKNARHTDTITL